MTDLDAKLFVFLLSTFLGLEVIRRVSPLLHTPLMSLTNAISAIAVVAAIQVTAEGHSTFSTVLGTLAVIAAMINIVGGFWITDRMLKMFRRGGKNVNNALALFNPLLAAAEVGVATTPWYVWTSYLLAAALFILSLKWLSHPRTARRGVRAGEIGMAVAIIGTLLMYVGVSATLKYSLVGMVIGSLIGAPMAIWMPMTAVPQRTALSHAFGALAAALVGIAHYHDFFGTVRLDGFTMAILSLEVMLGSLTFTGSLVAFGKLQELIPSRIKGLPHQNTVNFVLLGTALFCAAWLTVFPTHYLMFILLILLSLGFGLCLVLPIGGADMPTVISLLNSYAGLSASLMGFVLDNFLLIVAGALDGSSGLILSIIMCKAMNRSFTNVLFGRMDASTVASADEVYGGKVKSATADDVAMMLDGAQRVVIVPGYGLAVAQAQHAVRELYNVLTSRGTEVLFGIHPVAGRMPGHMNVLLAEADIPYDQLKEMDEINPTFAQTDVVIVIGANDVVNPLANTDPQSPIAGMPILNVGDARTVVVVKRSLSPGFAGIPNPLFAADNTLMLFEDGKKAVVDLVAALKEAE